MESGWYDAVIRLSELVLAGLIRRMDEIVRRAKCGRQKAWHEGHGLDQQSFRNGSRKRRPGLANPRRYGLAERKLGKSGLETVQTRQS